MLRSDAKRLIASCLLQHSGLRSLRVTGGFPALFSQQHLQCRAYIQRGLNPVPISSLHADSFALVNMKLAVRPFLVLVAGLLVSVLWAKHQDGLNQTRIVEELADKTGAVETKLRQRFTSYEYGLRGARGVVLVTDAPRQRALFRRYAESRDVDKEFPGARGFGFIRRVPADGIEGFIAQARKLSS